MRKSSSAELIRAAGTLLGSLCSFRFITVEELHAASAP